MPRFIRARVTAIALAIWWCIAAPAGQISTRPAFPTGTATIVGRVVNASNNQPVADANVSLWRDNVQPGPRMTTGADGAFRFTTVPAGELRIEATKPGFTFGGYGKKRPDGGVLPLTVGEGATIGDLTITMWPDRAGTATIAGKVTDERGQPIAGVPVRALSISADGKWTDNSTRFIATDPQGRYELPVVPGAAHWIRATVGGTSYVASEPLSPDRARTMASRQTDVSFLSDPTGRFAFFPRSLPPPPDRSGQPRAYASTFHGGESLTAARAVSVPVGERLTDIDITLPAKRAFRVSGVVTGPRGPVHGAMIRLNASDVDRSPLAGGLVANSAEDGRYDFVLVAEGGYQLFATLRVPPLQTFRTAEGLVTQAQNDVIASDPDGLSAHRSVTVSGDTTVDIVMRAGTLVTIKLVGEDGAALTQPQSRIALEGASGLLQNASARVIEPGVFRVQVVPGRYDIQVNLTGGMVPVAIRRGSQEVPGQSIVVGEDAITDVTIVTSRPASVSGSVVADGGQPAKDATVIVFPASRADWDVQARYKWRVRSTRTTTGRFTIENLAPGEYLIAAVDDAMLFGWDRNLSELERLAKLATPITLAAGTQQAPALRLR